MAVELWMVKEAGEMAEVNLDRLLLGVESRVASQAHRQDSGVCDVKDLFKGVGCFIAVLVGGIVLSLGIWGLKVAFSPVRGAGDVRIKDNSATNRIRAQELFYTMYNGIVASDKNLDVLAATVKAHPNDRVAQMSYDGAMLGCNQAVAAYNAETHKVTSKNWLDPDLPYEITGSDPATDCKPEESK